MSKLKAHDRFVRALMTKPKVIKEFFDQHLPEKIKKSIDFSSITPEKESFVDDKLRQQVVDLLYSVKFNGEPGFLYVLIEHASTPDKLLPYRMLKYMTAIMEDHLTKTENKEKLPLIYPIIMYTGEKPYRYSMDLFDLFEGQKELAKEIWTNPYQLIDFSQASDEELKHYLWFGYMALLTKHIHDKDILPFIRDSVEILRKLEETGEIDYIYRVVTYVFEAGEISDEDELRKTITSNLTSIDEEKIMTLAEQWKREGFKKGIEKGLLEGIEKGMERGMEKGKEVEKTEIARNLLSIGVEIGTISKATGLSAEEIKKLMA